ncbi:hypothetical protein Poly30_21330 [Planctomycetes bacterium Poly30]|uniref:Uncharacterized protein n=1 Tax=Saltatorellus ferox TaxID=2528018 RepID=A0A518ERA8_9BACT|nr:hypothetical protein Poly30_21330 [Planctomycetes bacterium Poly30]
MPGPCLARSRPTRPPGRPGPTSAPAGRRAARARLALAARAASTPARRGRLSGEDARPARTPARRAPRDAIAISPSGEMPEILRAVTTIGRPGISLPQRSRGPAPLALAADPTADRRPCRSPATGLPTQTACRSREAPNAWAETSRWRLVGCPPTEAPAALPIQVSRYRLPAVRAKRRTRGLRSPAEGFGAARWSARPPGRAGRV